MSKVKIFGRIYVGIFTSGIIGGVGGGLNQYKLNQKKEKDKSNKLDRFSKAYDVTCEVVLNSIGGVLVGTTLPVTLPIFTLSYLIN